MVVIRIVRTNSIVLHDGMVLSREHIVFDCASMITGYTSRRTLRMGYLRVVIEFVKGYALLRFLIKSAFN